MNRPNQISAQSIKLRRSDDQPRPGQSKMGGSSLLPAGVDRPLDKTNRQMALLVQINFNEVQPANASMTYSSLPQEGLLSVFVTSNIEQAATKDRKSYKFFWQPKIDEPLNVVQELVTGIALVAHQEASDNELNSPEKPVCALPGLEHPKLEEAKTICAFASNGVSHNRARESDSCYSHLVAQASSYKPLLVLHAEDNRDYLVLIHDDDFLNKQFEKAWLVWFNGNNQAESNIAKRGSSPQ